jgi:hypothetical protein
MPLDTLLPAGLNYRILLLALGVSCSVVSLASDIYYGPSKTSCQTFSGIMGTDAWHNIYLKASDGREYQLCSSEAYASGWCDSQYGEGWKGNKHAGDYVVVKAIPTTIPINGKPALRALDLNCVENR